MDYYDYSYNTQGSSMMSFSTVWIIISIIVAIIGGIALYYTVFDKKNADKYKGKMASLYNYFTFKKFIIDDILKTLYIILAIGITLLSFTFITANIWKFIFILIIGNIALRLSFELLLMFTDLCHNVKIISQKNKY